MFSSTNSGQTDNTNSIDDKIHATEISKIQPKTVIPQQGQTLFLRPVENCDFYTTKSGFENKLATNHLRKDHKVTPEDMTPGKYKFKNVNREKVSS